MKQQLAADNVMIMNGQAVVKTYYLLISRLIFGTHSVLISNRGIISMKCKGEGKYVRSKKYAA